MGEVAKPIFSEIILWALSICSAFPRMMKNFSEGLGGGARLNST